MNARPDKPAPWSQSLVARRLLALHEAMNIPFADVADIIDLDRSSYTKVLKGKKPLKHEYAFGIAEHLGVSMDFIYRGHMDKMDDDLRKKVMAYLNTRDR